MSAVTNPVDVLAVMDKGAAEILLASTALGMTRNATATNLKAARAAVAELIEASKAAEELLRDLPTLNGFYGLSVLEALATANARCGGAA